MILFDSVQIIRLPAGMGQLLFVEAMSWLFTVYSSISSNFQSQEIDALLDHQGPLHMHLEHPYLPFSNNFKTTDLNPMAAWLESKSGHA